MTFWGVEIFRSKMSFFNQMNLKESFIYLGCHCWSSLVVYLVILTKHALTLQATLGKGRNENRCIVLCSVGGRDSVNLCSLRAENNESCVLDLDFDEDTEVYFSVDGPLSVHLTGYYREKRKSSKNADEDEYEYETEED
ncbi:hypothetical protein C5167_005087 [Papaver somniferum]|uniref:peptidylprolyl isomerase n=1 Tax=Papaver somniferum TaxID=3469 RepID=A0A4Y7JAE2_PAPSO|nr:hypothetical protein C5167_005087 [Papaver somniferum]